LVKLGFFAILDTNKFAWRRYWLARYHVRASKRLAIGCQKEAAMHICIYEDRAKLFEPICLTRPVFDLRCGLTTLAEKQLRHFAARDWGVIVRAELEELYRLEHPGLPVNDAAAHVSSGVILVNGRWLPPVGAFSVPKSSCVAMVGDEVAYIVLRKCDVAAFSHQELPAILHRCLETLPVRRAGGRLLRYLWDVVDANADELRRDFTWLDPVLDGAYRSSPVVAGLPGQMWIAPSAKVEPMVLADTTQGPIVIDEGAVVCAFTRLEGPCYIGPHSQVFGAKIRAGTTLGPHCRVGGEVEASIIQGHSNKYHDGFLGHCYVGEWVNLGAGTNNSDLRNDYGEIMMTLHGLPIRTGLNKVGCFLGDHVKTGLGTLLNTGTNVGAFCGLLPAGRFAPKYLPSFTAWWNGSLREAFTFDQLMTTARIAMKRRGVELTDAHEALYAWLLDDSAEERRRVLRESEQKALRRSA
jgi:UDP-N-acetylglucosamine diphosphorylase/glucosamine-1-phosphate N-acetyltransferase